MTKRLFSLKSFSFLMTTIVALSTYAQPASAGGLWSLLGKTASRTEGSDFVIDTEVQIGDEMIPRTLRIPINHVPLTPKMSYLWSPHSLREKMIQLAQARRGDAFAAKKLLSLSKKNPELKAFLDANPGLYHNAEDLQTFATSEDRAIENMKLLQKADGGVDQDEAAAIRQYADAEQTNWEMAYPGITKLLNDNPEFKNILKKNPSLFKPSNTMAEQMVMMMYKMPIESLSFFAAQGAVYYLQLATYAGTNPLILEQHLNSQQDPVTIFSFMALLATNGVAIEPLMHRYGYNGAVRRILPYLGLTLGIEASNIVTELGNKFKDAPACQKEMAAKNGQMGPNCQGLADEWTSHWAEKINEFTPNILSMMAAMTISSGVDLTTRSGASLIAGAVAKGGRKISKTVAADVFKKVTSRVMTVRFVGVALKGVSRLAVDVMTDGGAELAMDSGFFALSVWQNTQFTFFMNCLESSFSSGWRNVTDSVNFNSHDSRLIELLRTPGVLEKADPKKVMYEVTDFGHDMAIWRRANLGPIAGADLNWQMKLQDMMNGQLIAHNLYKDFLDKLGSQRSGGNGETVSVDFSSPLVGMNPGHGWDKMFSPYLLFTEHARDIVPDQKKTALEVGLWATGGKKLTAADCPKVDVTRISYGDATPVVEAYICEAARDLQSGDVTKIGHGVRTLLDHSSMQDESAFIKSSGFLTKVDTMLTKLGYTPENLKYRAATSWARGESFVYGWDNNINEQLKGHDLPRMTFKGLPDQPQTLAQYYMTAMAIGPDVTHGGKVIYDKNGWKSRFVPPRLTPMSNFKFQLPEGSIAKFDLTYNPLITPVVLGGKTYQNGLIEALLAETFIKTKDVQVYDRDNTNTFEVFWEQYVGKQYEQAWLDYEHKYQVIVAALADSLFTETKDSDANFDLRWGSWYLKSGIKSNTGPAANGQVSAMNQEFQTYMLMLGRVMHPEAPIPAMKTIPGFMADNHQDFRSLLYSLRSTKVITWNFAWQSQMMDSYIALENFSRGLRVAQATAKDGHGFIVPMMVNGTELDKKLNRLTAQLDTYQAKAKSQLAAYPARAAIADQCFTQMKSVANELRTLLLTANSISWVATKDGTAMALSCNDVNAQNTGGGPGEKNRQQAAKDECYNTTIELKKPGTKDVTGHNDSQALLNQWDLG